MKQGTSLGSQLGRWMILAALVVALGALLLTIRPAGAQSSLGVPTGLTATAVGATTVELSWTAPTSGRDSVTGYRIEYSSDNGGTWADATPNGVPNTEAAGTQNVDVSGVQTYYSVSATAIGGAVTSTLYRVSAIAGSVTGDPSGRASATLPVSGAQPDAPAGVTATASGSTEINLSWTAGGSGSSNITGYKIEYSKNNLLPWMELGTTTVTTSDDGTEYSDTGLDPGTTRYYRVSAMSVVGRGPVSSTSEANNPHMAATTLAGVPAAPTGLTAVAVGLSGANAVELSWTAPNEGSAPITGYRIESFGDHDSNTATPNTWSDLETNGGIPNTEATGAQNAGTGVQTYYAVTADAGKNVYRVSAMNIIGMGPVSATAEVTPPVAGAQPGAPGDATNGVAALADGSTEIELTWTAAAAGATSTTGYVIEYSKDNSLPWMHVATVGNVLEYSNTGLAPGTTRYYRVSAVNSVGRGPVSATPDVTDPNSSNTDHVAQTTSPTPTSVPGRPTGLMATAVGTTSVELSWTAPAAGRDSVMDYEIETSVNNGVAWTVSIAGTETINTATGVQTYHVVTATAAQENLYRVSAINAAGTGDPSAVVRVTPPVGTAQPSAPGTVTATANGSTEINLAWTAPATSPAGSITSYKIEYSKDGNLPWMDVGTTTVTTMDDGTKYSDTGLAPDTTRFYRVSAMNIAGWGPVSAASTDDPRTDMATTSLAGVPAAPTGLTAVAVGVAGTDVVELSWTAPNEGRAPITGYKIEYSADGVTWADTEGNGTPNTETANTASGVQTHYVVDAAVVSATVKNHYRVSAMNIIGSGPVSDSVSVTPPVDGQEPAIPTAVMARPDGSSEIEVSWTAGTAGASAITGYKIEYSKDNSLPWMEVATTTTAATSYDDTGLDPSTTRYYRVSAINVVGRGPVSATPEITGPANAADGTHTDHVAQTAMGPADQMGTVTLSTQAPMVGMAITASLMDDDGMVSDEEWQWEKSMTPTSMNSWEDATGSGATTNSYTPAPADEDYHLRATVTYTDANRSDRNAYSMATDSAVALPADRMGTVTLSPASPEVGSVVTAILSDPDYGVTGIEWQWARSDAEDGTYADIPDATSASYTVADADAGMYLQATADYEDVHGDQTAASDAVMIPLNTAVQRYDTDGTPGIQIDELFTAIDAYFAGDDLSLDELFEIIDAYFAG